VASSIGVAEGGARRAPFAIPAEEGTARAGAAPLTGGDRSELQIVRLVRHDFERPLGLGHTFAQCHSRSGPVVTVGNWIVGPEEVGQGAWCHVPDPNGDAYLTGLNAVAAYPGERPLVFRLMPGWAGHLQAIGLLSPEVAIDEVDPVIQERDVVHRGKPVRRLAGYPYTDPLACAVRSGLTFSDRPNVATIFPTPLVREQVRALGGELLQISNAAVTNDKAAFREAAERYGFPVFPGAVIRSPHELSAQIAWLNRAFERAGGERTVRYAARLKDPRGSGGDGVQAIAGPVTTAGLEHALALIREDIRSAYELNDYGGGAGWRAWYGAEDEPFPHPLILEQDAQTLGEVVFNGSFLVRLEDDGAYSVPQIFGQRTDQNGSFRGGYSVDRLSPNWASLCDRECEARLFQAIDGVARYWYSELGVRGMGGVDFMLIRGADGSIAPYLFDPNVRPTINSISSIVADKVYRAHNFSAWANTNVWATHNLVSIEDLKALLDLGPGLDLFNGCARGIVVPMAVRSMFRQGDDGSVQCSRPSNGAKFLVAAPTHAAVEEILELLRARRGLRYTADEQ
jgi:hypothetical protein